MPPAPMMPTRIGSAAPVAVERSLLRQQRGGRQRRGHGQRGGGQELASFERVALRVVGLVAHCFPPDSGPKRATRYPHLWSYVAFGAEAVGLEPQGGGLV